MEILWLLWRDQRLSGAYAWGAAAESAATALRDEVAESSRPEPPSAVVRIEPWWISPPSGPPSPARARRERRKMLDLVHRDWGLLTIPEMGTGHHFHLDTYLAVPHENRLTFPAFQFDLSRELWPGFRDVLKVLRDAAWDEYSITAWFVSHQGSAEGSIPAVLIRHDPDRVLRAARISRATK